MAVHRANATPVVDLVDRSSRGDAIRLATNGRILRTVKLLAIASAALLLLLMVAIVVSELVFGRFRGLATRVMATTVVLVVFAGVYLVLDKLEVHPVSCPDLGVPFEVSRGYGEITECKYSNGRSLPPLD